MVSACPGEVEVPKHVAIPERAADSCEYPLYYEHTAPEPPLESGLRNVVSMDYLLTLLPVRVPCRWQRA